jgi:hypothetical protein
MEDLAAGNVPCQWRSCHGNSYAVVEVAECERLAQRLRLQRKVEQEAELKAKLGEAGYAEKKQQDADAARAAADAASAARITAQIKAAAQRLLTIVGVYGATALPRPAGRAQEPKATAKKLFKLTDKDLAGLETSTKATKARPANAKDAPAYCTFHRPFRWGVNGCTIWPRLLLRPKLGMAAQY